MHDKHALRRLEQAVPLAQLAVLGTWTKTADPLGTSTRTVRAFCWPEVGHAWTRLAEAIGTAGRRPPVVPGARWWMAASAPRMCQSLQGESPSRKPRWLHWSSGSRFGSRWRWWKNRRIDRRP